MILVIIKINDELNLMKLFYFLQAENQSYFGFESSSPRLQNLLAKIKENFGKGG
jgi:hypothetical protein